MKISDIKLLQSALKKEGLYSAAIDGKRGKTTNKAITIALNNRQTKLPQDWLSWSNKRKITAYLQLLCHESNINSGSVDGFYGPQTEAAVEQLHSFQNQGYVSRGFGDITPIVANPLQFPQEQYEQLVDYYGKPCEANKVRVACPWTLRLDWNLSSTTNSITIHEKLSESLSRILNEVYQTLGLDYIKKHGLDRYGGSYNCRKKRGSVAAWSTHAWGISIDWFPSKNKLRWHSGRASLADPELDVWWEIWEKEGWLSLGRSEDRDWMHIQAARRNH